MVLLALGAAWLGLRVYQVRSHLLAARADLERIIHPGAGRTDLPDLTGPVRAADAEVTAARSAAHDPVWRAVSAVPVLGRSFVLIRQLTDITADVVHQTGPAALAAERTLLDHRLVAHGQVDLTQLQAAQGPIGAATGAVASAQGRIATLSTRYVPGYVAGQRDVLAAVLTRASAGLSSVSAAVHLAPPMLGRDGPRRYFVAVMNQAESRAAGGFVGAYAILRAEGGRLVRERSGTDVDFHNPSRPVLDLGTEFAQNYDAYHARRRWAALGASPHWPYTARLASAMLAAQGGGPVDGVIGVDPLSMADLLGATGPAVLGSRTIGAGNVASFVFRDEYIEFEGRDVERKQILGGLAGAVFQRVVDAPARPAALVRALAHAVASGHLLLYSAHEDEQRLLHGRRLAGELPSEPGSFLSVITQNAAGNKLDSFLRRRVAYSRPAAGLGRVVVTLSDLAPPHLPPVFTARSDNPLTPPGPGETRLIVTIYCSVGAHVRTVRLDGVQVSFTPGTEIGHGTATLLVPVAPHRPAVLVADVTDPGGPLQYRAQALAVPDQVRLDVPAR